VPATRVTIVAMLEPVLAALMAWIWLEEELGALQVVGGLVVLAGVVLAQTARADDGRKVPESATMPRGVARESA
jgi:drug/metabolite transporter (DMT)-like permease